MKALSVSGRRLARRWSARRSIRGGWGMHTRRRHSQRRKQLRVARRAR